MLNAAPKDRKPRGAQAGLGATDPLTDAQTQLVTVSAYLTAAAAGTATPAQLTAAQTALVQAQADINNAAGAQGSQLPPGTWVKGGAVVAIAAGTGLAGGVVGYLVGRPKMKKTLKEKTR